MAKRRRSSAQKAAFKKMIAALHAKRHGGRGKTARRARRSGKRRAVKAVRKSMHKRRRSSKRRAMHVRHVSVPRHTVVKVYRSKRRAKHRRKSYGKAVTSIKINPRRRRHSRRARRNPAFSLKREGHDFLAGITHVLDNLKTSVKSAGGIASVGLGAIGGIFAGTFLAGITVPALIKMTPSTEAAVNAGGTMIGGHWIANDFVARLLAFSNYYLGGYLLARFAPGLSDKTRLGMMAGAAAAAIIETIRPGTIKDGVAMIPGVGPAVAAKLSDAEIALGDNVMAALAGSRTGAGPDGNVLPMNMGAYGLGNVGSYGLGAYGLGDAQQTPEMALGCGFDPAGNPL